MASTPNNCTISAVGSTNLPSEVSATMRQTQPYPGTWDAIPRTFNLLGAVLAVILAVIGMAHAAAAQSAAGNSTPLKWHQSLYQRILKNIHAPQFPHRIFNVWRYGARDDGKTNCEEAFRRAIIACHNAGGGEVFVPTGHYLCNGPITLLSGVNFHTQYGVTITFGMNPADYLTGSAKHKGCVLVRYEGVWCYNYSPLIYAHGQTNVAVTGLGVFNGQRNAPHSTWMRWYNSQQKVNWHDRKINWGYSDHLTAMRKRIFGAGYHLMPEFCDFELCHNVLIEGVTFKNSPFWTMHPGYCRNVIVEGVTVYNHDQYMDDGLDIDSCDDVLVQNCNIRNDDDNIVIKSGRNADAWPVNGGRPSENIIIRNNWLSHDIGFGSEMSGGIRNVMALNNQFGNGADIIYMKWGGERGGWINHIYFRGITCNLARCLSDPSIYHWAGGYQLPNSGFVPHVSDWSISHVRINQIDSQHDPVIAFANFNPCPFSDVRLSDIYIGHIPVGTPALWLKNAASIRLHNVVVGGVTLKRLHFRAQIVPDGYHLQWQPCPGAGEYVIFCRNYNTTVRQSSGVHDMMLADSDIATGSHYVGIAARGATGKVLAVEQIKLPLAKAPKVGSLRRLLARAQQEFKSQWHRPTLVPMHYTPHQRMLSHLYYCIHVADLIAHNPTATPVEIATAESMLRAAMH